MRFIVEEKVFEALPDMCVGVVVAKGVDNSGVRGMACRPRGDGLQVVEKWFTVRR